MKRCCVCNQVKPKEEFYKDKTQADGLHCRCKVCRKEYYLRNRDHHLEYNKEKYKNNKEYWEKKYREQYKRERKNRAKSRDSEILPRL